VEIITRELQAHELGAFAAHLRSLDPADRRLRFGQTVNDATIDRYVERIDTGRDAVFGVTDDALRVVGAAHVARGADCAELGVSVAAAYRRRGIGAALLQRAVLHARNWGIPEFFTHCLRENTALMRLARRHGLRIVIDGSEADGSLALPAPDPSSYAIELIEERVGRFDHLLKTQALAFRRLSAAWLA
jgi:GNAT superfamily N-acetyltransferase